MDPEFDPLAPPRAPVQHDSEDEDDLSNSNDEITVPVPQDPPSPGLPSKDTDLQGPSNDKTAETTQEATSTKKVLENHKDSNKKTPQDSAPIMPTNHERPEADEDRAFDYQQFLDQMRSKQATPIARYVKSFLSEFHKKNWTVTEQVKIINDFESFIAAKMRECPPFSSLEKHEWDNSQEGIEKLIMNRVYLRTFAPKMAPAVRRQDHEDDLLRDSVFAEKLRIWGWIEPCHLDISPKCFENKSFLDLACKQLQKINSFRAPRDKCICVLNCSKVIWALIRSAKVEANADSFLPILIFVILQAKPSFIISNINYINRFRGQSHMRGETAYYISMIQSALAFIEGLDKSSLSIDEQEYQDNVEKSIKAEKQNSERRPMDDVETQKETTAGSVLSASAGLLVGSLMSYANKIFEPDEVDSLENFPQQRSNGSSHQNNESAEELAAKQASAEEYRTRQAQEQEFAQTLETLTQMFPTLDKEVIEDVLQEKGTRIGAVIDVCLGLCE